MTIKTNIAKSRKWGKYLACFLFFINAFASYGTNIDSLKVLAQTSPFPDRIEHLINWYSENNERFYQPEIRMMKGGVDWLESLPRMDRKQLLAWSNLKLMLAGMYADNEELANLFDAASSVIVMADSLGNGEEKWVMQKGQAYFYLSLVASLEEKPDVYLKHLEKAYQCFESIGHKSLMAQALGSIGVAQSDQGDHQKAFETCGRAAKLYHEDTNEYGELRMGYYQAAELLEMKNWKEAVSMLTELVPRLKATEHNSYNIALAGMGEAHLNLGNFEASENNLSEALALAKERQVNTTIAYVCQTLAELEEKKGDFQKALFFQREQGRYLDSIRVQSMEQGLKDAQAKFEQTENQLRIKELEQKIKHQERSFLLKMGLLALGLLALAVALFWFFNKKKKKDVAAAARSLTIHLADEPTEAKEAEDPVLTNFLAIVQARLADEALSVEGIADGMRMSRVLLFQKIKAATGASPSEIIRQYRLEAAKKLLLENTMNISEVAYKVGFANPNSFTRAFKEKFGESPTAFLAKNKRD